MTNLFVDPMPGEVNIGRQPRFLEDRLIHRTERGAVEIGARNRRKTLLPGRRVCLRGAARVAERAHPLPDFTISDHTRGLTFYWKHLGMLDDPRYRARWEKTRAEYTAAGISSSDDAPDSEGVLIMTRDQGRRQ
jgi:hypothetical protein